MKMAQAAVEFQKTFKFGTGETLAGRGIERARRNRDNRNIISLRENNERAKPKYLLGR